MLCPWGSDDTKVVAVDFEVGGAASEEIHRSSCITGDQNAIDSSSGFQPPPLDARTNQHQEPIRERKPALTPTLRRLRTSDVTAVLDAFLSASDMARQGDVTTLAEAERYVGKLCAASSPHRPWAVCDSDSLVGLVCVTVDDENRSGWFWYWMTARARGRGWTSRAAATVADWGLFRFQSA